MVGVHGYTETLKAHFCFSVKIPPPRRTNLGRRTRNAASQINIRDEQLKLTNNAKGEMRLSGIDGIVRAVVECLWNQS